MTLELEPAIAEACRRGAEDVEVSYAGTIGDFVRFADSRFTQVGENHQDMVRVRVLIGRRLGAASCASVRADELRGAAERAVELANMSPPLDVELRFAQPSLDLASESASEPAPASASGSESASDFEIRADAEHAPEELRRAFDRASGVGLFGAFKRKRRRFAVLTAGGLRREHSDETVHLDVIAQLDDGSGWASWYGPAAGADRAVLSSVFDRAADTARRARAPIALEPGTYDVVLAPAAVAELLQWMALASFGARSVIDATSLLCGRAGQQICSPRVTFTEVCNRGATPFDSEGVTRQGVDFVRAGCAGQPVTDLVSAARLADGRGSTGHAEPVMPQFESTGPIPAHLRLEPGFHNEGELIAMVERGLYVTRLHYVNGLLDTRRATMTGMTRNGTFLIENGSLSRAVHNMRFTDSVLDALGDDRLGGIGRNPICLPTSWFAGGQIETAAILLRRFQFSGASR